MQCTACGRPARVLRVDEDGRGGAEITYVCANPACPLYRKACGREARGPRPEKTADKPF